MSDIQTSHDALAHALVDFTDQMLRGSHNPTPIQWMAVASALRGAVAHTDANTKTNPTWLAQVADLIDQKVGLLPR